MNITDQEWNFTFASYTENVSLTSLTTTTAFPTVLHPTANSREIHDPEFTIMMVLGLSLLLAGIAAFLAMRRRLEQDEDFDANCAPGESLTRGRRPTTEPQLKVWRRLGSYRRSYNLSFRRPPAAHRRPQQANRTHTVQPAASLTPKAEAGTELQLTTPCLCDYVTEI